MLVPPLVLIQIFSKRMLVDWPKCGSDHRDEGHLACLLVPWSLLCDRFYTVQMTEGSDEEH